MLLEDYLDFLSPDDIRIKGHRLGIDTVLEPYLDGYSPEEIAALYPELGLEKTVSIDEPVHKYRLRFHQ